MKAFHHTRILTHELKLSNFFQLLDKQHLTTHVVIEKKWHGTSCSKGNRKQDVGDFNF